MASFLCIKGNSLQVLTCCLVYYLCNNVDGNIAASGSDRLPDSRVS